MRRTILVAAALAIATSFATSRLHAATSGPFGTSTPIPLTLTDWSSSLDFPKFNSALGTLTSVRIELDGYLETTIDVENLAASPSSGNVKTEVQFTVQDGGNNLIDPVIDLLSPAFNYALNPGDSTTSGLLTKSGSSDDTYVAPAVLAAFNGPGTITLSASTFTQTLLANTGGNTSADQVTEASLTGQVTYTYNPVPEPATIVLGAFAAVGLALAARRRRK